MDPLLYWSKPAHARTGFSDPWYDMEAFQQQMCVAMDGFSFESNLSSCGSHPGLRCGTSGVNATVRTT